MLAQEQEARSVEVSLKAPSIFSPPARFWMRMIAQVSGVACALAFAIATLGAVAGVPIAGESQVSQSTASFAAPQQTYEGMITDARCGAKHSAAIGHTAADCARACVRGGEQFVLVDGDRTYLLEGEQAALQSAAGQRVRIVGTLNGRKISVTSVLAA
jgi:hypothetical protein